MSTQTATLTLSIDEIKNKWLNRDTSDELCHLWEMECINAPLLAEAMECLSITSSSQGCYQSTHHNPLAELMTVYAGSLRKEASNGGISGVLAQCLLDYDGLEWDSFNEQFFDNGTEHHNRALRNFLQEYDVWYENEQDNLTSELVWTSDLERCTLQGIADIYC